MCLPIPTKAIPASWDPSSSTVENINLKPSNKAKLEQRVLQRSMAADKEIVLLSFLASPFGMRVMIALEEKGLEYEYRDENLLDKGPLLLKMNPVHKMIPVLIHKEKPICESLIIVEYIDEVWKSSPLLPQDPNERATARFWADFIDKKIAGSGGRLWRSKGEDQDVARNELIENFKTLESFLSDKPFFGGESFGFPDISLIPFACWFYTYEIVGNFKLEDDKYPKLIDWMKRCMERESVRKTLPDPHTVYDIACKLRKTIGLE